MKTPHEKFCVAWYHRYRASSTQTQEELRATVILHRQGQPAANRSSA